MRRLLGLFIVSFTFVLPSLSQQPEVLAPHKHALPTLPFTGKWHKPAVLRSMVGGLWMTDANFKSSIYIKNNIKVAPITVTPILYLSNGQKLQLADAKLEPAGISVVSINQALSDNGIAPWATLRGYVEIQYKWPWDALCVTVVNVDVSHSLVLTHNLRPATLSTVQGATDVADQFHTQEGVWWKQEADVTGFVAISNPSATQMSAQIQVSDNQGKVLGRHTVALSPHGTKVVDLREMQATLATEGGVSVTYQGPENGLLLSGGLEDTATGYSANLPLHRRQKPSDMSESFTYAAVGLMTGEADPMMRFPAGTRFTPYFVLRNLAGQAYTIQPKLYWVEDSASRSVQLPQLSIPPYASANLNVASLIARGTLRNFNGSVNLVLDFQGHRGDLVMASGSVDQKNTYVFQVMPQAIGESAAKGVSYWSTGDGNDTMVTLWNPADEAQDFTVTLFFSGGQYNNPMHLRPKATRSFNISEIIQTQVPDDEGNLIPPGVHEGSAEVSGPEGESQLILLAMDVGVYNVQKATCPPLCLDCAGVADAWIDADPFAVAVGSTVQQTFTVQYKSGTQYNATSSASWKSSKSGVGTVKSGLVTGVSAGSLNVTASEDLPTYNGQQCLPEQDGPPQCTPVLFTPGSPGTVQVPTASRIVSTVKSNAINSGTTPACPSGQAGWYRQVHKIVTDQNGNDVTLINQLIAETVTLGRNDLNIGTVKTSSALTVEGGYFDDVLQICSPVCPGSTGETDGTQAISDLLPTNLVTYSLTDNAFKYTCRGNYINGQ
jgi:hypothetical protein